MILQTKLFYIENWSVMVTMEQWREGQIDHTHRFQGQTLVRIDRSKTNIPQRCYRHYRWKWCNSVLEAAAVFKEVEKCGSSVKFARRLKKMGFA